MIAVAYLTTRVSCPNEEDESKMWRILKYLRATRNDDLILRALNSGAGIDIVQSIDAAYGCHEDYKSPTGSIVSLGIGSIQQLSSKQKINGSRGCRL